VNVSTPPLQFSEYTISWRRPLNKIIRQKVELHEHKQIIEWENMKWNIEFRLESSSNLAEIGLKTKPG